MIMILIITITIITITITITIIIVNIIMMIIILIKHIYIYIHTYIHTHTYTHANGSTHKCQTISRSCSLIRDPRFDNLSFELLRTDPKLARTRRARTSDYLGHTCLPEMDLSFEKSHCPPKGGPKRAIRPTIHAQVTSNNTFKSLKLGSK